MNIIVGAVAQGLLWAIMAIGVYITYRVLDIADLTAEGCFTLGASVVAFCVTKEMGPFTATFAAIIAGMTAGVATGILHTRFKIPALLSGILTMTALYSINLRVMGGKSNVSFLDPKTLSSKSVLNSLEVFGFDKTSAAVFAGLLTVTLVILLLLLLFNTEIGFALWATGNNEKMVRALGVNTDKIKILGLIIGNGLVGLSSALVGQYNGFSDIAMGTGTIVIGLSSVIIGEVVFVWIFELIFKKRLLALNLVSVVLGSITYRLIIAAVLQMGLSNKDLKLFSSIILVIFLVLPIVNNKYRKRFSPQSSIGGA